MALSDYTSSPFLFEAETRIVERASPARRLEFAHGRACAHQAIAGTGLLPGPILAGADRAPVWPSGIAASISHCASLCAAAAARSCHFDSLGIDVERLKPLPLARSAICTPEEISAFPRHPAPAGTDWAMIAFVAKEAFYKCQYPLTGRFLEFHDGRIRIVPDQLDGNRGHFRVEMRETTQAPRPVTGRWAILLGHIFAAALSPTDRSAEATADPAMLFPPLRTVKSSSILPMVL